MQKKKFGLPLAFRNTLWVASIFILASCVVTSEEPKPSQEELLHNLGIDSPGEFALLPPCKQIEVYTEIGSQYLDIDHATAIVPRWMNEEIAKQPREEVANCIAAQGEILLGQWVDVYTFENEQRAFRIHALIYKADNLNIMDNPQIERFVLDAICEKRVYYRGRLAILYYAATQSDLQNFPNPDEIIATFCN